MEMRAAEWLCLQDHKSCVHVSESVHETRKRNPYVLYGTNFVKDIYFMNYVLLSQYKMFFGGFFSSKIVF